MKIAYIMRGVPGSGKSTIAKMLANGNGVIHSTDDYFYVDGEYCFNPFQLSENHDRNFQAFCRSLDEGVPIVICDNTNVRRCDFEGYVNSAIQAGYLVAFVIMSHPKAEVASERTAHKVPVVVIQRMIDYWED